MKKQTRTRYRNVAEMVRDSSEKPAFAEELLKRLADRRLVKLLAVLRCRAGLSQPALADRLGCTPSKLAKLESGKDADVRIGELLSYTDATDHAIRLFFVPKRQTLLNEVEMHAGVIGSLLNRLVELVGDDPRMADVAKAAVSTINYNLGKIVQKAIHALPAVAEQEPQPFQVEAPDVDDAILDEPASAEDSAAGLRQKARIS